MYAKKRWADDLMKMSKFTTTEIIYIFFLEQMLLEKRESRVMNGISEVSTLQTQNLNFVQKHLCTELVG